MSLEAHIRELLATDNTLQALISCDQSTFNSRIGFVTFTGPVSYPALLITLAGNPRSHTLDGPDGWAFPRVQIDCYAATYEGSINLATAVRKLLDGYTGTRQGTYIGSSSLVNERDFFEEEVRVFRRIVEFSMIGEDS